MEHHQLVVLKLGVWMNRRTARLPARLGGNGATNADNDEPCSVNRAKNPLLMLRVVGQQSNQVLVTVSPERRWRRPTTLPSSPQRLRPTQR